MSSESKYFRNRIIMTSLFILTLLFLLIALVFSWFASNSQVTGSGISVKINVPESDLSVVLLDSEGGELPGDISFSGMVPGLSNTFKIQITNNSDSVIEDLTLSFGGFEGNTNLFDVIDLSVDGVEIPSWENSEIFSTLTVQSNETVTVECTFSMQGSAGNEYQAVGASISEIVVSK